MKIALTLPQEPVLQLAVESDPTIALAADTVTSGGVPYKIGHGLKVTGGTTLEVDTADAVEQDNTKPITSAGVYTQVGNIEVLLAAL